MTDSPKPWAVQTFFPSAADHPVTKGWHTLSRHATKREAEAAAKERRFLMRFRFPKPSYRVARTDA